MAPSNGDIINKKLYAVTNGDIIDKIPLALIDINTVIKKLLAIRDKVALTVVNKGTPTIIDVASAVVEKKVLIPIKEVTYTRAIFFIGIFEPFLSFSLSI